MNFNKQRCCSEASHASLVSLDNKLVRMKKALTIIHAVANFYVDQYDNSHLLDDVERTYFNEGYTRFYSHIMTLFDKAQIMSHVVDFAELALEHCNEDEEDVVSTHFPNCHRSLIKEAGFSTPL